MTLMQPSFSAPVNWRRVGALSSSLCMHGIVIAVGLLVILSPVAIPKPPPPADALQIDWVEAPPIAPPVPPVATLKDEPLHDQPVSTPHRTEAAPDISTLPIAVESRPIPGDTVSQPMAAIDPVESGLTPVPAAVRTDVAYDHTPRPRYPMTARRDALQGETLLRVWVDTSGRARQMEIARSSGHRVLDRAAIAAVRDWRFQPATENGVAIEGWVEIPVAFRLESH